MLRITCTILVMLSHAYTNIRGFPLLYCMVDDLAQKATIHKTLTHTLP